MEVHHQQRHHAEQREEHHVSGHQVRRRVHLEAEHVGLADAPATGPAREPLECVVLKDVAIEHERDAQGDDGKSDPVQAQGREPDDDAQHERRRHADRDGHEVVDVECGGHHARGVSADSGKGGLAK